MLSLKNNMARLRFQLKQYEPNSPYSDNPDDAKNLIGKEIFLCLKK